MNVIYKFQFVYENARALSATVALLLQEALSEIIQIIPKYYESELNPHKERGNYIL